jgi:hypothetical protein
LLCLRNARAFPLLPAALASVPFGFVLVRVQISDSYFYFFNGLFGGWKEPNRRGFTQIGPYKPLKRALRDDFF